MNRRALISWAIRSDAIELQRFLQGRRALEDKTVDPVDSRQAGIVSGKQNTKQCGEIEDFVRNFARQVSEGADGVAF